MAYYRGLFGDGNNTIGFKPTRLQNWRLIIIYKFNLNCMITFYIGFDDTYYEHAFGKEKHYDSKGLPFNFKSITNYDITYGTANVVRNL